MPSTARGSSTTTRCSTPESSMSTTASTASWSGGTVTAGARQPLAQRPGDEPGARGPAEHGQGRLARKQVADRVLVRPDGERGSEPGQERRVPEALARLEDVDHLVLVHELHRPVAND